MLVATWNVNSLNARIPRVEQWLDEVGPDVLCLQETKLADDAFPVELFTDRGYEVACHGLGQWNGVAIASRIGLAEPINGFAGGIEPDQEARLVSARCGVGAGPQRVRAQRPRGRPRALNHYKLSWLARLRQHLEATVQPTDQVGRRRRLEHRPDRHRRLGPGRLRGPHPRHR